MEDYEKTHQTPVPPLLGSLDSLSIVEEMVAGITEAQLKRAAEKLHKISPKETTLGVVHNMVIRKLWVVSVLCTQAKGKAELAMGFCDSNEQEKTLRGDVHRFDHLDDVARDLMWLQIHQDMNSWHQTCGIREGWMVVVRPPESPNDPRAMLAKLFGGE